MRLTGYVDIFESTSRNQAKGSILCRLQVSIKEYNMAARRAPSCEPASPSRSFSGARHRLRKAAAKQGIAFATLQRSKASPSRSFSEARQKDSSSFPLR